MGAMPVFSKLIVLVAGGHLLDCEPYDTGAIVMLVCVGVLVCVDGNVLFTSLFLLSLCLGSSLIGLHRLIQCLCLQFLQ